MGDFFAQGHLIFYGSINGLATRNGIYAIGHGHRIRGIVEKRRNFDLNDFEALLFVFVRGSLIKADKAQIESVYQNL